MRLKSIRPLHINNIVAQCDDDASVIVEYVQDIIDDPQYDIPPEVVSREHIVECQKLQAYYANNHAYLMGLWGMMRVNSTATTKQRNAVRDYLEGAASSCKQKYAAASRALSGMVAIQGDSAMGERIF